MSNCEKDRCQYHILTESIINDLKESIHQLMEGQRQMQDTVIRLTESFKAVERLEERMYRYEEDRKEKEKEQDEKIDEVRTFMIKVVSILTAIGVALPYILKAFGI